MKDRNLTALNRGAIEIDGVRYVVAMRLDAYGQEMLFWECAP